MLITSVRNDELLERLLAGLPDAGSDRDNALLRRFVRHYFRFASPEDLAERDPIDLRGAALCHLQLGRTRRAGQTLVHLYNPQFERHGWQSTHSVVEIVTDDRSFLVDSVSMALNRAGLTIHLTIHPVFALRRDPRGRLIEVLDEEEDGAARESFMHFEVDKQTDPRLLAELEREIRRVLTDVECSAADWPAMRDRLLELVDRYAANPPPGTGDELGETLEFCRWIAEDHFTFLGHCEHRLERRNGAEELVPVAGSELGVLRNDDAATGAGSARPRMAAADDSGRGAFLVITKSNARSTVHRNAYLDYVGLKSYGDDGAVVGEYCFLGLFTASAYSRSPHEIPLLRSKVRRVIERIGVAAESHRGKALLYVLDTFPRDDLFQISEDDLVAITVGIMELQERQRIRLFMRRDAYGRFYSCLVYVPRERYNRELRQRVQQALVEALHGDSVSFTTFFSESVLARIHFVIHAPPDSTPRQPFHEIEQRVIQAARSWPDQLRETLVEQYGEARGVVLYHRYADAFPASYREEFSPRVAGYDIEHLEAARREQRLAMNFFRPPGDSRGEIRFKLYVGDTPVALSDALPVLENMGLRVLGEKPFVLQLRDRRLWIHEFELCHADGREIDTDQLGDLFQETFARVWDGAVENDGFNRLVLSAGLDWREIVVLRACCKYLLQIPSPFSQAYMERALAANPRIARLLLELFHARFDPERSRRAAAQQERAAGSIEAELEKVASLDEDRILRAFLNLIQATLRTNFYQHGDRLAPATEAALKPYLALKIDSGKVARMPQPRPHCEIFVYSPRLEAIHLRGGPVARGGLRWSDRREDFRTEVLGLMKAQMVKNALIVPTGSKGGFVVKRPPEGDRERLHEEVVACYKTFICGLLDLTDNLVGGEIVAPPELVRFDGDDPYLVVAADKGTATFSDIANGVSEAYGFWLGDAFASGGATGYDHKRMGITARGAWESVKRHFRELGRDIQAEPFSVIGIGDMAGDVFGNGMLLSRQIRLVAAFNHQHIFLDPEPDPEASYTERERLFGLPRSSWADYDAALISTGGGVFARSAKSIALSPQIRERLRINAERLTPAELIQTLLRAPADLLWNGGIGTYVRASDESDADARDRANDALRVAASELRCKVVGEGGNLGFTQRARIEFALAGGRINTDAIDNSGGVDCSDHEVNIKILLNGVVADGELTRKQRDRLLAQMTDEVAALVLAHNYNQSQALSLAVSKGPELLDDHARYIREFERRGRINRRLEALPDDEALAERAAAGRILTRPELAVLLSYSKITLYEALIESTVPEDPHLAGELARYFPPRLAERFGSAMERHRLRREIVATHLANGIVDRVGPSFRFRIGELTGAGDADIARAAIAARDIFGLDTLWQAIEALDNRLPAEVQLEMLRDASGLLERATLWLLRNRRCPLDLAATVDHFREGVALLVEAIPKPLAAPQRLEQKQRSRRLAAAGVPRELATRVGSLAALSSALDIVEAAHAVGQEVLRVAQVYWLIGAELQFFWLRRKSAELAPNDRWHALAKAGLRAEIHSQQRYLAIEILRGQPRGRPRSPKSVLGGWIEQNRAPFERFRQVIGDLVAAEKIDFAMLSVALSEVHALRRATSGG